MSMKFLIGLDHRTFSQNLASVRMMFDHPHFHYRFHSPFPLATFFLLLVIDIVDFLLLYFSERISSVPFEDYSFDP